MDSSHVEWHVKRGLPKAFRQRKDIVAITGKHKLEDYKIYRQEFHELGLRRDGTPKIHKIFADAPIGSPIILTEEQYGENLKRRDELKRRYMKKKEQSAAKKAKKGKFASYCGICKETFRSYLKVNYIQIQLKHMNTTKHKKAVERDRPIYAEIDGAFTALNNYDSPKISSKAADDERRNVLFAPSKSVKSISRLEEGKNWPVRRLFDEFMEVAEEVGKEQGMYWEEDEEEEGQLSLQGKRESGNGVWQANLTDNDYSRQIWMLSFVLCDQ
eukprot:TRINITY_DN121681_c0_g1_i1.p1 TRINITY_DN121681_c0_g1~~TRINITY_DN121681_c0_g1_i1.p1  ORF type:complete len:271 (+),score=23.68 TRINITY_DN121681_c0_g1_i1:481-1293(+)